MARLREVHPVIEVGDMARSLAWYRYELGFEVVFADADSPPSYAGLERDGVQVHLQAHHEEGWSESRRVQYRFLVDDPDELLNHFRQHGDAFATRSVADTAWGTREFGIYDPDGNALFFYRDR
ncbi:MAG: glyoxalase superfamily protein [Acidimicrobiales bacterium]|nr:VOC family protein [Acidimicrobiales bacterium]